MPRWRKRPRIAPIRSIHSGWPQVERRASRLLRVSEPSPDTKNTAGQARGFPLTQAGGGLWYGHRWRGLCGSPGSRRRATASPRGWRPGWSATKACPARPQVMHSIARQRARPRREQPSPQLSPAYRAPCGLCELDHALAWAAVSGRGNKNATNQAARAISRSRTRTDRENRGNAIIAGGYCLATG